MKKELRLSQSLELSDLPCQENDHTVLHRAATILRKIVSDLAVLDDYPNPSQLSLEASSDLVPAELYRFILWLLYKNAHAAASEDYTPAEDIHRKSLAIAETIIFNSTNMLHPSTIWSGCTTSPQSWITKHYRYAPCTWTVCEL